MSGWFRGLTRSLIPGCLLILTVSPPLHGEDVEFLNVDPRALGLDLPAGLIRQADGERVATYDESGRPAVARLLVRVGDQAVVVLPDGQIVVRGEDEAPLTERTFKRAEISQLAKTLTTGELADFKTLQARHYLFIYNTSDEFAQVTQRILGTMIPRMKKHARKLGINATSPQVPLVAIMFRTKEEFQRYRRTPPGIVAYYHPISNHIVMCEETSLSRLKPELGIKQTISTIAHEGAHQILHNIGVQARLSVWPTWLSEGLAEYYAPTTFTRKLNWKGPGQVNDLRMFELEMYLKSQEASGQECKIIEDTVQAGKLTSTGYASAWSLTYFLAKTRKDRFNAYLREVSRLGPLQTIGAPAPGGLVPANVDHFRSYFGDDLDKLESQLIRQLDRMPYQDPFGEWPHFVAMIVIPGKRKPERDANLFHTRELAEKWIDERLKSVSDEQRVSVQSVVQDFPSRPLAEGFARHWLGRRN